MRQFHFASAIRLFTVPYFFVRSSRYSASYYLWWPSWLSNVPRGQASGIIAVGEGGKKNRGTAFALIALPNKLKFKATPTQTKNDVSEMPSFSLGGFPFKVAWLDFFWGDTSQVWALTTSPWVKIGKKCYHNCII